MQEYGMFEAKTRFSELVDQVNRTGQPIRITRRGKPVVIITPDSKSDQPRMTKEQIFDKIKRIRKTLPAITAEEIRESIDEGRM
ncbi:type II toxin-antitoxin system Phd/YefM family antitoxin [Mucisphaera calidilacus]|uniref:Antitoxin n=1 Tax=Mucisphaera calidilacus TaxID=2527982 RepID=A0A518BTH9_9BACT|nr:type II toxin-antitoxin system Phd/YefM family antitoxin [Mucisphaera calidilacus]QDU70280.1 Phd_YefM [Mucisphaera calidilacus]